MSSVLQPLFLDDAGTHLAYLDSGAPSGLSNYVTIFAVHGIAFTSPIFRKVASLAPEAQFRLVAINRRDYPSSSPISEADINKMVNGTDEDKHEYLKDRGLEILKFIDLFIQRNNLPPISEDGATAGVALLGWSLGISFCTAAIANSQHLESDVKTRLAKHVRSLVLQDPPTISLGMPFPTGSWFPPLDGSIPPAERWGFTLQWLTAYFQHGDLSKRDLKLLSFALPSAARVPSIFSIHPHFDEIVFPSPVLGSDGLLMRNLGPQLAANYQKACFDPEMWALFPKMKIWEFAHESGLSLTIAAFWQLQDDDAAHGGGNINFHMIPGTNHFIQWDDPTIAVEIYKKAIA